MRSRWKASLLYVAALLALPTRLLAGPPLLCHPVDIGEATSLPWTAEKGLGGQQPGYDLDRLVDDTMRLLQADTPVLVRMETLRRATLYAHQGRGLDSAREPHALAQQYALAERLYQTVSARASLDPARPDALRLFDAGYLTECLKQAYWKDTRGPWAHRDGTAMIKQALKLRGDETAMEFALALVLRMSGPREEYAQHLDRAEKGAARGSLVAKNVARHREEWRGAR